MMLPRIRYLRWLWLAGVCGPLFADVSLPSHFTSGMVLQRDRAIRIAGRADAGEAVTVSFAETERATTANAEGAWSVTLDPMRSSHAGRTLVVRGKNELRLEDVLVGDVWFASGQSNMEWTVKQTPHLAAAIGDRAEPSVRFLKVKKNLAPALAEEVKLDAPWRIAGGEAVLDFSAVGYAFATRLRRELDVPIGVVVSAYGGSRIEPWLSAETWATMPPAGKVAAVTGKETISGLYNGMAHPLTGFPIKGILWYQGESSARWWPRYPTQFRELITSWRAAWNDAALPFVFVQIAPFKAVDGDTSDERWAWTREAQATVLDLPRSGMVVTTDLGEYESIHPLDKVPVGERLAGVALQLDGKIKDADSPRFESVRFAKGKAELHFMEVGAGLETRRVALNRARGLTPGTDPDAAVAPAERVAGFVIAGEDQRFVPAEAKIVGKGRRTRVVVWSPEVPHPVAVRYAWANFPVANLYGKNGLPVAPFRTDDFAPPEFGRVPHP